jgi:fatty acid-binding protein DegV
MMARRLLLSYRALIGVTVALLALIVQLITARTFSRYLSDQAAAQPFGGRVTVIDSHSLSLGYGLQVLTAARLAGSGAGRAEIVAAGEEVQQRSRIRFFLESLGQAHQG